MKYLITSALPYANGPIHFGHVAGVYLPADIYAKHRKMQGHKVMHISGSDEHGVAIIQNANKAEIPFKEYVDGWAKTHQNIFDQYGIKFDFYGQTSAPYHAEEVVKWFDNLYEKGFIEKEAQDQLQCQSCTNFLPDRFVEGTCYVCGYKEARGDECPDCGTWVDAVRLKDPVCKFCDSKDIEIKSVDQWYLKLTKYHKEYREWLASKKDSWRKSVFSFVDSLSKEKMVDRAITRDLDWGIDVPLAEAKGKKLYVWFDAPIGYVSNTKEFLKNSDEDYIKDWWGSKDTQITNFIGKDNIIFHALIFPVMSLASGIVNAVDELPANQYVNLEGKQFSKSKGWYIDADKAVEEFGEDNLRYYLTSLIPDTNDSSYTWSGFENKINGELVNNIGNFINRSLSFTYKNFKEGLETTYLSDFYESKHAKDLTGLIQDYQKAMDDIQLKRALDLVMKMGNLGNLYFSEQEPWAQIKTDEDACKITLAHSAAMTYVLAIMMKPFLPKLSGSVLEFFDKVGDEANNQKLYAGDLNSLKDILGDKITLTKKPKGLVQKVDSDRIKELQEELKAKG